MSSDRKLLTIIISKVYIQLFDWCACSLENIELFSKDIQKRISEKCEDTNGVIRSRNLKARQYNCQRKESKNKQE